MPVKVQKNLVAQFRIGLQPKFAAKHVGAELSARCSDPVLPALDKDKQAVAVFLELLGHAACLDCLDSARSAT